MLSLGNRATSHLNAANPGLWQGLLGVWSPRVTGPTGPTLYDLSPRRADGDFADGSLDASTDWVPTDKGWAINVQDAQHVLLTTDNKYPSFTDHGSLVVIHRVSQTLNAWASPLFHRGVSNSNTAGITFFSSSSFRYHWLNTYWFWDSGITAYVVGKWQLSALTVNPNAGTVHYCSDGDFQTATNSDTHSAMTIDQDFELGRDINSNRYCNGDYVFAGIWDRELSVDEIITLWEDHDAVLRPKRQVLLAEPEAAVAGLQPWQQVMAIT